MEKNICFIIERQKNADVILANKIPNRTLRIANTITSAIHLVVKVTIWIQNICNIDLGVDVLSSIE